MKGLLVLYVFLWLLSAAFICRSIWQRTKNWAPEPEAFSKGTLKSVLRSFALAYTLSPTVVVAGFVGIPMPASFFLIFQLIEHGRKMNQSDKQNFHNAILSFLVCWAIVFIVLWAISLRKSSRATRSRSLER